MIEQIGGAPKGVLAFKAVGEVEAADYKSVLEPAIEAEVAERGKIRLVFELGPEFKRYAPAAALQDLKLGMTTKIKAWERCAVVTDNGGIAGAVKAFDFLMPGEVKVFPVKELTSAMAWAAE